MLLSWLHCSPPSALSWHRLVPMNLLALELFFVGLLGLASLSIAWVAGIVVFKLFKGQR
ncbi:hypothetical protein FB466_1625 [Klugiella xanthotipulae]|uniref:Uncharacterized protein n=1 Tax=Klugiella xanthotipulae TaxID=244735 RepID=A0A543HYD2_9MICO|nr:hypothetical protein FB466_1625 [Klugiella xanthotipulae]